MPYSLERQQRHKLVEDAITSLESVLSKNSAEGGHISPANMMMFRFWLERLTVPNIRNGVIQLGKAALRDENYIPIVAVLPSETLYRPLESIPLMPLQGQMVGIDPMSVEWQVTPEDTRCNIYRSTCGM